MPTLEELVRTAQVNDYENDREILSRGWDVTKTINAMDNDDFLKAISLALEELTKGK